MLRFRWVACQLDTLRDCYTHDDLMEALESLPVGLYQTYDRILSNIRQQHSQGALRIFQWLAFSSGAISLREAIEVLATDPDSKDGHFYKPGRRPLDSQKLLAMCSSLVTITFPDAKRRYRVDFNKEEESI